MDFGIGENYMIDMTAIILTFNEEENISECITSIKELVKRIVVIDSFSTDATVEIAKQLGAEVYQNKWVNYANQYQYAIDNCNISSKWIFRIDADERLTQASAKELEQVCKENENTDVNGIIIRFEVVFMGKKLRHGGIYPFKKLLVYKNGKGYMEQRNMDEHIILTEGRSISLKNDSIHRDYKDLTFWIDKHNKYSSREVMDYENSLSIRNETNVGMNFKSWVKFNIYYKLPMGFRAWLYYIYRYIFKLGFLDGREGKIYAFLQAYWYRFLVDAKLYENSIKGKNI